MKRQTYRAMASVGILSLLIATPISRRPNSGPKKGTKFAKTIAKEEARELLRQIVMKRMEGLVASQRDNAEGIKHLMYRDPVTGKFERVTGSED